MNWFDIGKEDGVQYHKICRSPMIWLVYIILKVLLSLILIFSLNSEGNVESVRHSIPQRDSHFTVDVKYVKPWYEALRTFVDLINEHAYRFKTQPGKISF